MSDEIQTQDTPWREELNGALKRQRKDFEKALAAQQEQFSTLVETLKSTLGPKTEPAPLPSRAEISEDSMEMKKQIKILLERDKQRDETEKSFKLEKSLRDNLGKHGINSRSDLALKYLKDQVSYDEEGQLVMKFDEVAYPLADAVAKFAQTDQGKFLADPKDIRGSGAGTYQSQSKQTSRPITQQMTNIGGVPIFKDAKSLMDYAVSETGRNELKF
jgi:hypothetical protein